MKEYINGRLYINGYATDGAGRPRTMSNGYSSEDEKDAQEEYLWAKQQEKSNSVDLKETKTTQNTDNQTDKKTQKQNKKTKEVPYKFYSFKKPLPSDLCKLDDFDNYNKNTYYLGNGVSMEIKYLNGKKYVGGYATNDAGEPICYETGYGSEDVIASIKQYEKALSDSKKTKHNYYNL